MAPADSMSPLTSTATDPREAPGVGARRCAAAPTAKPTSPWKRSGIPAGYVAMDLVEVVVSVLDEVNHTAELAVGLMASAFGQRII